MTGTTWVVATPDSNLGDICERAAELKSPVAALVVGPRAIAEQLARQVDRVDWFPPQNQTPSEAWACAVAEYLGSQDVGTVIFANSTSSRVLAGAVAARLAAPVFTTVQRCTMTEAGLEITRLVYGGIAEETDLVVGNCCLVLEGGPARAGNAGHEPVDIQQVNPHALPVSFTSEGVTQRSDRDLANAARVVGVGRGLRYRQRLTEVEQLAGLLDADIACSRPVAEDLGWLPTDRYLGVSGRRIAPRLYLMLGISGEVQHMIGVRDASFIVSINSDPRAPAIGASDLSVVGDVHTIVPALINDQTV